MNNVIVIPYRDREEHLERFLESFERTYAKVIPNIDLCVVEQEHGKPFNRGLIKNIGGIYALDNDYGCIFFNDVDCLPSSDLVRTAHSQTKWDAYRMHNAHARCLGGIVKVTTESFHKCNGFPSDLWEWGIEDRSLYYRYVINDMTVSPWCDNSRHIACLTHDTSVIRYSGAVLQRDEKEQEIFNCGDVNRQLKYIQRSGVNTAEYTILEANVEDNVTRLLARV